MLLLVLAAGLTLQAACASAPQDETMGDSAQAQGEAMESNEASAPENEAIDAQQTDTASPLGSFTAVDIDGNTVTESVFANAKVTMLNVWATFCGPCLNEMPDLGALSKEYADRGVQIIGLVSDVGNSDKDVESVRALVEKTGANYTHLLPSEDLNNLLLNNMMYVPTTLFFDANGRQIGEAIVGSMEKAQWASRFDQLLESVGEQTPVPSASNASTSAGANSLICPCE